MKNSSPPTSRRNWRPTKAKPAPNTARYYSSEQVAHGRPAVTVASYLGTSQFWFESLQNWQSEFLAIGAMVVLSIFLRQKGSPESKPVDSPHRQTGG